MNYGNLQQRKPSIIYDETKLMEAVDEACRVLVNSGAQIYARGTSLVRPVSLESPGEHEVDKKPESSLSLVTVCKIWLGELLTKTINWYRASGHEGILKPIKCPPIVAEAIIARKGDWHFPQLLAVTSVPIFREDGSIVTAQGFDKSTGILFRSKAHWPEIESNPTREKALECIAEIKGLIATFPFPTEADRSGALALILTAMTRSTLPTAPLFAISAPTPGTGKSKLIDVASVLATGRRAAVMSASREEEEMRKQIGASLAQGAAILTLDNIEHPLKSEFLCQVLTQETVRVRILGESRNVDISTNATICATGNSLRIEGDLTRRTVLINLDARHERPEERVFDGKDPVELASDGRVKLVTAALTFLKAFFVSKSKLAPPLGSFEGWSNLIRSALVWIGEADPLENADKVRESDPERERTTEILNALPAGKFTVSEIANLVSSQRNEDSRLENALEGFFDRGVFSRQRFGNFLRKHQGRILDGKVIRNRGTDRNKTVIWEVESIGDGIDEDF